MNAIFQAISPVEPQAILAAHSQVNAIEQRLHVQRNIVLPVAEELPIALVYNGISHVVLMATPQHLLELAYGFSLSEGIIQQPEQIYHVDIEAHSLGITIYIELASACFAKLKQRRRQLTGRTGCGLCGIEALSQINTPLPLVTKQFDMNAEQLNQGFIELNKQQSINQLTGGCHAAALWQASHDLATYNLQVFEDVGRHNALDKLIGWRCLNNNPLGAVLLTSRLSYELIQKAAYAQLPLLAAISAPTGMAVRLAQDSGIKLAVFVREGRLTWLTA